MNNKPSGYDFGGYATRNDTLCADGRIIRRDAFSGQNGSKIPIVYQHDHDDPTNVIGHGILENRNDGVYMYGYLNNSPKAQHVKECVAHGDLDSLSIWANQLKEVGNNVVHGVIQEVSLVLKGANPKAIIDNPVIAHGDGYDTVTDEAIIYPGVVLDVGEVKDPNGVIAHADDSSNDKKEDNSKTDEKTVSDVYNGMTDEQKEVVAYMVGEALASKDAEEKTDDKNVEHSDNGDDKMKKNAFATSVDDPKTPQITHEFEVAVLNDARRSNSFKDTLLSHAASTYGISNIDVFFPDAKNVRNEPDMVKRQMDWVNEVINGSRHTPFGRIRSTSVDLTAEAARARGYIKGKKKVEEVITAAKRVTTPQTIYKKQKLDRDDIVDITDFNVVAFLKSEMRLMLNEELARAALIGDGRSSSDDSKIGEDHIRPVYTDDDLYVVRYQLAKTATTADHVDAFTTAAIDYEGSGVPVAFMSPAEKANMLLLKDTTGRRIYATEAELSSALGVRKIVTVPLFNNVSRTVTVDSKTTKYELIAIVLNMADYTFGADKGGEVNSFEGFDIDYNQMKYLLETRCSGALTKPKSAMVIEKDVTASAG